MNLDLQQIANTWVQAQILADARQVQLDPQAYAQLLTKIQQRFEQ